MSASWSHQGCPKDMLENSQIEYKECPFYKFVAECCIVMPSPNPIIYVHTPCSFILLVGPRDRCIRKASPVRCAHNGWRGVGTCMQTDPICSGRDCIGRRVNGNYCLAGFRLPGPRGCTPLFQESHRTFARDLLAGTSPSGTEVKASGTGWQLNGNVVSGDRRRLGEGSRIPHRLSADHPLS